MLRKFKDVLKKLMRVVFEFSQRYLHFDILPHHFYSEIPDIKSLRNRSQWRYPRSMIGINGADIDSQKKFFEDCCSVVNARNLVELGVFEKAKLMNSEGGFGPVEADFLFCFIGSKKPKKIIQIGAGLSTAVVVMAREYFNIDIKITAIDPYPNDFLINSAEEGQINMIRRRAQDLSVGGPKIYHEFSELSEGDLLFIDSTHTVKPDSEVNFVMFEVLPRLKKGVYVHFHDIYFPYDYKRDLLSGLFFSNESALLQAFLCDNNTYKIAVSLSMLHYSEPQVIRKHISRYKPQKGSFGLRDESDTSGHFPSSTFIQKII